MDYNILSKVESVQAEAEALEDYFEARAARAADKLLPDDNLPRDYLSDSHEDSEDDEDGMSFKNQRRYSSKRIIPDEKPQLTPEAPTPPPCAMAAAGPRVKAYKNLPECWTRNFLKGFALGFSGRVAIGGMAAAWAMLRRRNRSVNPVHVFIHHLSQMDMQPVQFGLFLGALLSTHNSIMYATRAASGAVGHYRSAAAAAVAAWASLFLPRGARRVLALVVFVRALEVAARLCAARRWLPRVPHADVLLFAAASARVMWTWIFHPQNMDASYLSFVNRIGGKPQSFLHAVPHVFSNAPLPAKLAHDVERDRMMLNLPSLPTGSQLSIASIMYRPNETAGSHFLRYVRECLRRTVQVYLPVHILPLLLFNSKRLRKEPVTTLLRTTEAVARSSIFLATYCGLGWLGLHATLPLARLAATRNEVPMLAQLAAGHVAGAMCALGLFFEKPSRRIELALYVSMQAIRTFFNTYLKGNKGFMARQLRRGEAALFSASLAVMMHGYSQHPHTVRLSYYRLLLRLFDCVSNLHKPLIGM